MSIALTCPQCGALLPPGAERSATACAYCGATAVPPPAVVERVVERVVVVPKSGETAAGALSCPRCAVALQDVRSSHATLHGCTSCGGVWLDKAAVDHLSRERDADLEKAAGRMLGLMRQASFDRNKVLSCPVCTGALRRSEIPGRVSSIDVCDTHGTWFDRGEVVMFAEASADTRAGEVTEDDLHAAGVGGGGFFSRLFGSLRSR
jgi:Zn-finger nucleic acid-binding protein